MYNLYLFIYRKSIDKIYIYIFHFDLSLNQREKIKSTWCTYIPTLKKFFTITCIFVLEKNQNK